jgi:hypothetical protein
MGHYKITICVSQTLIDTNPPWRTNKIAASPLTPPHVFL